MTIRLSGLDHRFDPGGPEPVVVTGDRDDGARR